jgi:hypothetical protein
VVEHEVDDDAPARLLLDGLFAYDPHFHDAGFATL